MADQTTLLFKRTRASIDTLTLDASLTEDHSIEVAVTDHPVERGADVNDHRRVKPRTFTLQGIVTNTPMPTGNDRSQGDPTRVTNAWQTLKALAQGSKLLTVVTALETYENMTITSLRAPRDGRNLNSLPFTATLKEMRIVDNKTVQIEAKTKRAHPQADEHKKATPEADDSTKKKSKSILKAAKDSKIAQGIFDFLGGS